MVDSSSFELLQEMNHKAQMFTWWPLALLLCGLLAALLGLLRAPIWANVLLGIVAAGGVAVVAYYDMLRKTVVLFYDLEPHVETAYEALVGAFEGLASCRAVWHVDAQGDVGNFYEKKINAGADKLVKRKSVYLQKRAPSRVKTNILIPCIPAGRQTLYLFPDRMLVYDTGKFGAIAYDELVVESVQSQFIETSGVPSDARVVGSTWRYVNKSGGPDRRFNDNREIPIALYEELFLRSKSGLRELFQLSQTGVVRGFREGVEGMANAIVSRPDDSAAFIKRRETSNVLKDRQPARRTTASPPPLPTTASPPPLPTTASPPPLPPPSAPKLYLLLEGQQTGPYALEDMQRWLAAGTVLPEDLVWCEGLPEWTPLRQLITS